MRVNLIILALAISSTGIKGLGQPAYQRKLGINDSLPELAFEKVMNYPSQTLRLSQLRGKAIILDFWNHHCKPCVEAFPDIDSMQREFGDKVQFILVNKESQDSTLQFFSRRKKIKKPEVTMITGDTLLSALFPTQAFPSHVWVDNKGVIKYIASGQKTTAGHIEEFLKGQDIALQDLTKISSSKAIVQGDKAIYYSYISRCMESIRIGNTEKVLVYNGRAAHLSSNCSSIIDLYKKAYQEYDKYRFRAPYSIDLQVKDPAQYVFPDRLNPAWVESYCYSYDLQVPASHADEIYSIMQQDLNRFFHLEVEIKKRKIKSLVLVKKKGRDLLKTKGGEPTDSFAGSSWLNPSDDSLRVLINQPFKKLERWLHLWFIETKPFFSNVYYDGNIDISLPDDLITDLNIEQLRRELQRYGLDLRTKKKKIDVLVIRDGVDGF